MTESPQVSPPESDPGEFRVGCVAGVLSGVIGDAVATGALIIFHPDWLFGSGDPLGRIVAGLAIGWAVALAIAVVAGLVLLRLMSMRAGDDASSATASLNVVLVFVVPAVIAAGALWMLVSVNR